MLSTFDARRAEALSQKDSWTYPRVPKYHITDDLGTLIDPECVLTTTVWRFSAVRYRISFVVGGDEEKVTSNDKPAIEPQAAGLDNKPAQAPTTLKSSYTVTQGILPRPNYKNSSGCVWYISPPDENFQVSFHVHSKTHASMVVSHKDDASQTFADEVEVSLARRRGSVRHRCIVGEVWLDMRLFARLSHRVRHLPWAVAEADEEYDQAPGEL